MYIVCIKYYKYFKLWICFLWFPPPLARITVCAGEGNGQLIFFSFFFFLNPVDIVSRGAVINGLATAKSRHWMGKETGCGEKCDWFLPVVTFTSHWFYLGKPQLGNTQASVFDPIKKKKKENREILVSKKKWRNFFFLIRRNFSYCCLAHMGGGVEVTNLLASWTSMWHNRKVFTLSKSLDPTTICGHLLLSIIVTLANRGHL